MEAPSGDPSKPPFELKEEIGKGSFAVVYRGEAPSGTEVAVKVIDLEKLGDEIDGIQGEINVLSHTSCSQVGRGVIVVTVLTKILVKYWLTCACV